MKLAPIVEIILTKYKEMPTERSLLAGISGIDASGKGYITAKLADKIRREGFNVAVINVDGWLNLPEIRFSKTNAAENFYENAIRFDEIFENLILPLKNRRSINLFADFAEEIAAEYRKHQYFYEAIDIILLEGIFLFKNEFKKHFDVQIWIECPFEIALQRAIARTQENLSPEETVKAYETIYFPAQKIHFAKDTPQKCADLIWENV
jgi:uridine kinase